MAKDTKGSVYDALMVAASRIGWNNYCHGVNAHVKKGRKSHTYRYQPTSAHKKVIKAATDVLSGKIKPEHGMAVLHEYEVMTEKSGTCKIKRK